MGQLTYKIIIKKEHVRKERNMSKRVYISADYSESNGDRAVVDELHKWGKDKLHKVDYVDTAEVVSGSVSENPDCRPCDLKKEFNSQINVSSAVIIVIGDKTASRTAGSVCKRNSDGAGCDCTPYVFHSLALERQQFKEQQRKMCFSKQLITLFSPRTNWQIS